MRPLIVALLVCALPALAVAEGRDYDTANHEWRGLSELMTIAAGRGLTIEQRSQVSWSDLGASDVLFIIYPTTPVEPAQLKAFLRGGGRVLIADDFGRADKALAALGIVHRPAPRDARGLDGNADLPFARSADDGHMLTRGMRDLPLVTNHPSTFRVARGPDVLFTIDDEPVVVAGTYDDRGIFVAIADPSVLINAMLAFDGNLTFAVNLLDFLAKTRPGRIVLVTHEATLSGAAATPEPPERGLAANDVLGELSPFLEELNDYIAPTWVLRIVGGVLGGLALIVGLIVVPLRRGREPDDGFARLPGEPAGNERVIGALDDERHEASYAYPATILRHNAEAELEARRGSGRREVEHALAALRRLPSADGARQPEAYVSRRDFIEAHAAVAAARRVR